MHPGIKDQRGVNCGSFPLTGGKERGRTHSEAMSSSLVHAFRQSSVKPLRRTPVCGSQRPKHNSSSAPSASSPRFISASSSLFISSSSQHILHVLFLSSSPPPSIFSFFLPGVLLL